MRFTFKRLFYCAEKTLHKSAMEALRVSLLLRIPELSKANVKIANPGKVCDKLRRMSEQGKSNLQAVFDFDKTISKPTVDGETAVGSLEIFKIMEGVPKEFLINGRKIMLEYYKYIKETKLEMKELIRCTGETMAKIEELMKKVPIPDDTRFEQEAVKGKFLLRDGAEETFKILKDNSVPLLILSGGLTCVISAVLNKSNVFHDNIHIMANGFKYKDGHIDGFTGDQIHFFNKNICYLKSQLYKKELSKRQNIILVGDAAADGLMTDGVPDTFNVLKIGFFHDNYFGDNLEEFQQYFDIVVTEDETMLVVNAILKYILSTT